MKKFVAYLIRWQASGIILAPCIWYFQELNGWNALATTIVANLIGGAIFFNIDKLIFKEDE